MPATGAAVAPSPLQPKAIRLPMMLHNSSVYYKGTLTRVINGFLSYYIETARIKRNILWCRVTDPGSNAFLTPGPGIWDGGKTDPGSGMIIGLSQIIFPRA